MFTWLGLLKVLLGLAEVVAQAMANRQLIALGEAKAFAEGNRHALALIEAAHKARLAARTDAERMRDSIANRDRSDT